ncbi:MAG: hypothetical protein AYK22_00135 [Thermoplasmatales archaeon SG8-52-3]|nr:MAG: hypothetical protein AYK22_00135 [Thermoplasmatales archaeon SG8-52-3]
MLTGLEMYGITLPLWVFFLIGIIALVIVWKLIKFAIKILLIIVVFFIILIGIDYFDIIGLIQNLFSGIISF